jgi:hypothetical protein
VFTAFRDQEAAARDHQGSVSSGYCGTAGLEQVFDGLDRPASRSVLEFDLA